MLQKYSMLPASTRSKGCVQLKTSVNSFRLSLCAAMIAGCTQAQASDIFDPNSPYMLGSFNGQRAALKDAGYDFSVGYTGEAAGVLDSDKTSKGSTKYADQTALNANLDLNKILGWKDTEAQVTITYRSGQNLTGSSDALKGQLSQVQEVYGRGQTWRLTNLWIKKQFFDQKLDVKIGRFGQAGEFNGAHCDFQNLALCGGQIGNWAGDQWYNWPVSQWAIRAKYNFEPNLYMQVGVFEHNNENLRRSKGFNLSTDGSNGAIIPVELVWQPKLSQNNLPGEYRLGYSYSTVDRSTQNTKVERKQIVWVSMKQKLMDHLGDANRGLTLSASASFFNNDKNNPDDRQISDMQNIAFSYTGLFDAREKDEIAVGVGRIHRKLPGYDNEYNAEIYYGIHATNWLTVRPNVQYIHHVGALKDGNNAWVGGLKFMTVF